MSRDVIYTGHFVADPEALLRQIPPHDLGKGATVHAHHVTREFRPIDGAEGIEPGRQRILHAVGQVAAEGVHAVLVVDPNGDEISKKTHPHVTIATAEGVPPQTSDTVLAAAHEAGTIVPIEPPIELMVIEGYFDGQEHRG